MYHGKRILHLAQKAVRQTLWFRKTKLGKYAKWVIYLYPRYEHCFRKMIQEIEAEEEIGYLQFEQELREKVKMLETGVWVDRSIKSSKQ